MWVRERVSLTLRRASLGDKKESVCKRERRRERERGRVWVRERERESVCEREGKGDCVREREGERGPRTRHDHTTRGRERKGGGALPVQGYLAHKKLPPPLGPPYQSRHGPTVGSYGVVVS